MERILDALHKNNLEGKETGDSESSCDRVDFDEEITLVQYQKKAKSEALARRGVEKVALRTKKVRNNPY